MRRDWEQDCHQRVWETRHSGRSLRAGTRPTAKIGTPIWVATLLLFRRLATWFVSAAGRSTWMPWACCDRPLLSAASPPRTCPTRHRGLRSAITLGGRRLHLLTDLGWWPRHPLVHCSADSSRTRTMAGMLWAMCVCGAGPYAEGAPAGVVGRCGHPFQHRRCEGALLASFCAVMLRGGTLQAVLGQPSAGVAGERIRGAWLYCTCAGSRTDQQ